MTFRVISRPGCIYCTRAKALLSETGIAYSEEVCETPEEIAAFKAKGHKTFPQVFDGEHHVGGFDALVEYLD